MLLRGANCDVEASFPVKSVDSVTLSDFENNDLVISSSPLYSDMNDEFFSIGRITDLLYQRTHWTRLITVICRESSNLYYSRLKVADSQIFAKAQFIYVLREGRHVGLSLLLDSLRFYSVDIDVRSLADFLILKSQGIQGLTRDLSWLYQFFNPAIIRSMKPENFVIVSKNGALGLGTFPEISWHKKEQENILGLLGIKVTRGEAPEQGEYKGTFKTVGDQEHAEIIRLTIEENLGLKGIADQLGRSSRTPFEHLHAHNRTIERSGFCPMCKRVNSKHFNVIAQRSKESILSGSEEQKMS